MKRFYIILTAFFILTTFTLQSQSILLVNDNNKNPERIESLKKSLDNIGLTYTYFNTIEANASPAASYMEPFDVVLWYTGNDSKGLYFWNANDTVNTEL